MTKEKADEETNEKARIQEEFHVCVLLLYLRRDRLRRQRHTENANVETQDDYRAKP